MANVATSEEIQDVNKVVEEERCGIFVEEERESSEELRKRDGEKERDDREVVGKECKLDEDRCALCDFEIESGSKMIECERCEEWICNKCHGLSKTSIKLLKDPGIHWVYRECEKDTNIGKLRTEANLIVNLEKEINNLKDENNTLEKNLNESMEKVVKSEKENEQIRGQLVNLSTKKKTTANEQDEVTKLRNE